MIGVNTNIACPEVFWSRVEYTVVIVFEESVQIHGARIKRNREWLDLWQEMLSHTRDPDEDHGSFLYYC
jgi:hypothetical protein